ncbi:MAG: 4-(cytidine 5'-diphospho)-2-C-methyl-D-erythritol kinase [Bacteroidetes bacterium]|nr:MAG: 4-(cytidine 5'-diphospho)-2-C-methyl-D-erythritol kinase [Bacteroidota bacterium]
MILFPHCKINLGLRVIGKRPDGFHDIETVFYPFPLRDIIEVIKKPQSIPHSLHSEIEAYYTGLDIPGESEENICIRAYTLLKKDFPNIGPIELHLHKIIPIGAGLGGGSSDGAFMLRILNEIFNLQIPKQELLKYAAQLGSDCPFFIYDQPCFATGRGEVLEPISFDLTSYSMLLVNPNIHVNTAQAFSSLKSFGNGKSILSVLKNKVELWKNDLTNDFESSVFEKYPAIQNIKQKLYDSGAIYASMTGSGSSVYGIFPKNQVPNLFENEGYFKKAIL